MSSLSAGEIHIQNINSGWKYLYNIEKHILLSYILTSFFFFFNTSSSPHPASFHCCTFLFCLGFSKLAFSQESGVFCSQATKLSASASLPCSECGSVVRLLVKRFQIHSVINQFLLIIIMMNIITVLCSKYAVSFQEYEDRFSDRVCPVRYKHLNI